jgi:hypothetical protein
MRLATVSNNSANQNSVGMYGDFLSVMFRIVLGSTSSPRYCMAVICFITSAIFLRSKNKRVYTNGGSVVHNNQLIPWT